MINTEILFNEQIQIFLLSLVPGLPLLVALTLLCRPLQKIGLKLAPWSALPALAAALFLKPGIDLEVVWFFMGGRMGLDLVGLNFLLLTALVWLLSAFFGQGYLAHDHRRYRFFFFYLLCMGFNFGLILARDMLGFYLFFSLMSFSAYGLIVHTGSREARLAGKVYIVLVMLGEVLLLSGMLVMAGHLPDLELTTIAGNRPDFLSLLLILVGFGIKAGALPLHVWLPLAHPVAPAPGSAVLSGVMIKAGLLGWLRFLPISMDIALPGWGFVFVFLGFMAVFYGVFVGLCQQDVKTVLAYSSISQMGLMTAIVGCGLLAPHLWTAVTGVACLYALHHGLAKASLFLGAGVARNWPASRSSLWLVSLLILPCLALAGFPLTGGAIAKLAVKEMTHGMTPLWRTLFEILLPLSAVATTTLLYHFFERALPLSDGEERRCSSRMIVPWCISVAAAVSLLWIWRPMGGGYGFFLLEPYIFWQGFWPVALGCGLMIFIRRLRRERLFSGVPAGDILWVFYGLGSGMKKIWSSRREEMQGPLVDTGCWRLIDTRRVFDRGRQVEKKFMRWLVAGFCYVLLCFVLIFLLLKGL